MRFLHLLIFSLYGLSYCHATVMEGLPVMHWFISCILNMYFHSTVTSFYSCEGLNMREWVVSITVPVNITWVLYLVLFFLFYSISFYSSRDVVQNESTRTTFSAFFIFLVHSIHFKLGTLQNTLNNLDIDWDWCKSFHSYFFLYRRSAIIIIITIMIFLLSSCFIQLHRIFSII